MSFIQRDVQVRLRTIKVYYRKWSRSKKKNVRADLVKKRLNQVQCNHRNLKETRSVFQIPPQHYTSTKNTPDECPTNRGPWPPGLFERFAGGTWNFYKNKEKQRQLQISKCAQIACFMWTFRVKTNPTTFQL